MVVMFLNHKIKAPLIHENFFASFFHDYLESFLIL
jgi:hypothetical protein